MIISVGGTWYYRTKDMNFFPPEEALDSVRSPEASLNESPPEISGPPSPPPLPDALKAENMGLPSLNSFQEISESETLQRFFSIRRAEGDLERAYLAGERFLESPDFSEEDKAGMMRKMAQILPQLNLWVVDENEILPATLELYGGPTKAEERTALTRQLEEAFLESSGGLLSLEVLYKSEEPKGTLTIAETLSFSLTMESPVTAEGIYTSMGKALRQEISESSPQLALPALETYSADEFKNALTRQGWALLTAEAGAQMRERLSEE